VNIQATTKASQQAKAEAEAAQAAAQEYWSNSSIQDNLSRSNIRKITWTDAKWRLQWYSLAHSVE